MRTILLRGGRLMKVDDEDYERFANGWGTVSNGKYAAKKVRGQLLYVHRLLMPTERGQYVDHIDGDRLNNQKANLRASWPHENGQNKRKRKDSGNQFKGVQKAHNGHFRAEICVKGQRYYLGHFQTEEEAARAWDAAALRFHGEFAATNVSLGLLKSA